MTDIYRVKLGEQNVEIRYDGLERVWSAKHKRQLHNQIEVDISKGKTDDMLFFDNFETRLEWEAISQEQMDKYKFVEAGKSSGFDMRGI
tara:strand:- start:385 stop:651 length:267 start_codon:yes stop_codon:yes gene_type:complete